MTQAKASRQPTPEAACPCHSGQTYAACCQCLHLGAKAQSAEQLMRSRYSAYVAEDADYLLATWHPDTRPASIQFEADTRWLGLSVRKSQLHNADTASVEFVARYRVGGGRAVRIRENSQFTRTDGRWYYLRAEDDV